VLEDSLTYPVSFPLEEIAPVDIPRPAPSARIALIVAGVGRSGTSALTRVLNLLGAMLPEQVLPPAWGNEKGFWEPSAIVELNDEILRDLGSDWYDTHPLPQDWYQRAVAHGYLDRIVRVLERLYHGSPLIVIKDPRLCRLGPLYFAALERLRYAPRIILPVRHPNETSGSLARREGTDSRVAELLWIRHMLETEAATRRYKRIWVSYDHLLRDWRGLATGIADGLDLIWPTALDDAAPGIDAFLDPAMRHFDSGASEAGPIAARLWACVQRPTPDMEVRLRREFDTVNSIVTDLNRLEAAQAEPEDTRIEGLNHIIAGLNGRIRALHGNPLTVAGLQHRMDRLRVRTEALEQALAGAMLPSTVAQALAALQADSRTMTNRLDVAMQSPYGPLTRPLHWLKTRVLCRV
jgi:hypothetical protein